MSSHPQLESLRAAAPVILPSMLLCDFANLASEIHSLEAAGAQGLHLDVMDGHFVPNMTYGMTIVEATRKVTEMPLDVHLMIENPEQYVEQYAEAGADIITIHAEAVSDPVPVLQQIRQSGAAAGLAINPPTPVATIEGCLGNCDMVLVMSVMPGFGGQSFDPVALEKLQLLRSLAGDDFPLQVDGGINSETIGSCATAGANFFVAGSAIFRNDDYAESMTTLTDLASKA